MALAVFCVRRALEYPIAFLLRRGQARQAMPLAQKAHKLLPNSQAALALLGIDPRMLSQEAGHA